jgi:hypothetical protein
MWGVVVLLVLVAAGLLFPLTWVWWYVRDEDPYHHEDRLTDAH